MNPTNTDAPVKPEYDAFAWTYHRRWGFEYHAQLLPVLDRLVLTALPAAASILDLCCGTGRVSNSVAQRGFRVTGIDISPEMVAYARELVPAATFEVQDARDVRLPMRFDAVISVFESLNHIIDTSELLLVFGSVRQHLKLGGWFVFDLNREPAFRKFWNLHHVISDHDHVCALRSRFREDTRIGECDVTVFRMDAGEIWQRSDTTITQKCHDIARVRTLLHEAGFDDIRLFDSRDDLGMRGDAAEARTFFRARARSII
ncbi:MAG: class I SAM-dependent methyltransferase [Bryobacterales bacterium]|nr:class I SAM-dependent methyltransferase [Bryobacterales bacterium]